MKRFDSPLVCSLVLLAGPAFAQEGWTTPTPIKPAVNAGYISTLSPTGHASATRATSGGANALFITPVGDASTMVSGVTPGGSGVNSFQFAPNGAHVVFDDQLRDVYGVPTNDPTAAFPLSAPLVAGGKVSNHFISPNSARVVYRADQEVVGATELYSVPIDGSAAAIKLNGTLVAGGDVLTVAFSPDGKTVLYIADQELDEQRDLYSVPTNGSAAALKVNIGGGQDVFGAAVTADGATIVFDSTSGLYSAPLDGSAPPTYIGVSSGAWRALLSPDGQRVAWRVGSTLWVGSTTTGGAVSLSSGADYLDSITFSPDSLRVFWQETTYLTDAPEPGADRPPPGEDEGLQELWSANSTGGGVAQLASDYWYSYESYFRFAVSEDSGHVVYQNSDHNEVWSVPATGGAAVSIAPTAPGRKPLFVARATRRNHVFITERDASFMDEHLLRIAMNGAEEPEIVVAPNNPSDNLTYLESSASGRHVVFSVYNGVETIPYATLRKVHLDNIAPYIGPQSGGTVVWLRGDGFSEETEVFFGKQKVPALYVDDETLIVTSPPAPAISPRKKLRRVGEVVDVKVRNVGTESKLAGAFSYYR